MFEVTPIHKPLPTLDENPRFFVTPSKPNPWRACRVKGQWYTHKQLAWMRENGRDPNTVPTITMHSEQTDREIYAGWATPQPIYDIPCPLLARSKDGTRALIVSPTGDKIWVNADGTTDNWGWAKK